MFGKSISSRYKKFIRDFRDAYPIDRVKYESGVYVVPVNIRGNPSHKSLVWYPSPGCQWSVHGGCTMCNFGANDISYTADEIVQSFSQVMHDLDPGTRFIHLGPGGSFFRKKELPHEARLKIFELFKKFPFLEYVGAECRADLFREEDIEEAISLLPPYLKEFSFGFGLETSNDTIRKYSVYKGTDNKVIEETMRRIINMRIGKNPNEHRPYLSIDVYILQKPPFLSEREAYLDTIRSIEWSFEKGADTVTLFPNTIKSNTLCEYLNNCRDLPSPLRYETPYFYSILEVLKALPDAYRRRVVILGMTSGKAFKFGPRGCDLCSNVLFGLISAFNYTKDPYLLSLSGDVRCACRKNWLEEFHDGSHKFEKNFPSYLDTLTERFYKEFPPKA